SCEHRIDPARPQKSWRTAWRKLARENRVAGRPGSSEGRLDSGHGLRGQLQRGSGRLRRSVACDSDLRRQAITKMAEAGASDATLMAVACHMSRRMLEHYSHVRMAAKRTVLDKLETGLMGRATVENQPAVEKVN